MKKINLGEGEGEGKEIPTWLYMNKKCIQSISLIIKYVGFFF